MKKLTYLLILFFISNYLLSQKMRIVYEIEMRPDTLNLNKIEKDVHFLDIINFESYYYAPLYVSFNNNEVNQKLDNSQILNKLKTAYTIYNNLQHNTVINYIKLDEYYAYKDDVVINWDLKKDTLSILGHLCKSATMEFRGRKYTAWYALDIPINEGPYKFKKLPGLILKISSDDRDYSFEAVEIKNIDETSSLIPSRIKLLSRKKYLKVLKQIAENPSKNDMLSNSSFNYKTYIEGKEVSNNEKYKLFNEMIWRFMKNHNNPVEKDDIWIR
ncbi:GLPGLI family protein [Kaistella flava (ex Peng et al. 2021)]|uniref:GLPGLI family protein n=1 Tax=Kaistella flava (ex Peng et al. 2021) TaxID=2038776 RepID=UPI0018814A49|nr:GLPGLI family protein [Kaistella flava (ex Peng et al. 2021)]